jgi:hypothetical protein
VVATSVVELPGGASLRRYWRVVLDGVSRVVMTMPRGGPASEELGKPGASAGADFVDMARWLEAIGLPVPRLDRVDLAGGAILLEDLGDRRLYDAIEGGADLEATYTPALALLVSVSSRQRRGRHAQPQRRPSLRSTGLARRAGAFPGVRDRGSPGRAVRRAPIARSSRPRSPRSPIAWPRPPARSPTAISSRRTS